MGLGYLKQSDRSEKINVLILGAETIIQEVYRQKTKTWKIERKK